MDALRQNARRVHATWWSRTGSVLVGVLAAAATCSAQSADTGSWFVRTGATSGYIFAENPFTGRPDRPEGDIPWGPDLTLEIGRQTDGTQQWHQLYGLPSYGFGVSLPSFSNSVMHAHPVEVYTFFSWPFARLSDRLDLTTDFGMGVSWRWNETTSTATSDTSLGSDLNARINWGFYLRYATTPRISLFAGVDYTHRSNGGMVQPNIGINVIGPKFALQYSLASTTGTRRAVQTPPPFHPGWELIAGAAGGVKNVIERREPLTRNDYMSFNGTAALQRRFYRFGKIALGADVAYDGATGVRIGSLDARSRADGGQRWALGLYGGYEHVVGRFGPFVEVGHTVARGFDDAGSRRLYQRFGWRYNFNPRYWTAITIRAVDGRRADALQVGVGYRIGGANQ